MLRPALLYALLQLDAKDKELRAARLKLKQANLCRDTNRGHGEKCQQLAARLAELSGLMMADNQPIVD